MRLFFIPIYLLEIGSIYRLSYFIVFSEMKWDSYGILFTESFFGISYFKKLKKGKTINKTEQSERGVPDEIKDTSCDCVSCIFHPAGDFCRYGAFDGKTVRAVPVQ